MRLTESRVPKPSSVNPPLIGENWGGEIGSAVTYKVIYRDGHSVVRGLGRPAFTFQVRDAQQFEWLVRSNVYSTALAFTRGDFDIDGDIISAVRFKTEMARGGLRDLFATIAARFAPRRLESWFQSSSQATHSIRFQYGRSNDFYASFLDSRMVYSCAYFQDSKQNLDDAQLAKLDHICSKLDLHPDERFLDIGCGWGALVIRVAEKYGVLATGCTDGFQQELFAAKLITENNLEGRVMVEQADYRKFTGPFRKIASVGNFEQIGRHRLREYFHKVFGLLADDGLFLHHGIVRPEIITQGQEALLLHRNVFPGAELTTLCTLIREAERVGFEFLDVENLRPHYALTCRRWIERLQQNAGECRRHVNQKTYRTWLLYLAGSALSFETGAMDLCQILMAKPLRSQVRQLTRNYIYS